jgi:hypothetical protein
MSVNTAKHYIDDIGLQLDEDCYGANGELDDQQIRERLMQKIVERCNYNISGHSGVYEDWKQMSVTEHEHQPAITLLQAASMILGVYEHMDRQFWASRIDAAQRRESAAALAAVDRVIDINDAGAVLKLKNNGNSIA